MRLNRDLAFMLLAIYLILAGLSGLGLAIPLLGTIAAICALAAGILMLVYR